ncbi:MAG: BrnT family toxin [Rhodospirillales bacterium]|nr:BrnT family toxin [Rhodospirillales bacterium]
MIEWDQAKSRRNFRERGFDFAFAAAIFEAPTLEMDDDRFDYRERRIRAIGQVEDQILCVVYTWRGIRRRIISARSANRKERDLYAKAL